MDKTITPEDFRELDNKFNKLRTKISNPHSQEYSKELLSLLNAKLDARSDFVNWITGLATGAMFLSFTNLSTAFNIWIFLSSILFLLSIIFTISFKFFAEVRFAVKESEVSVLKVIWENHNITMQLKDKIDKGEEISEDEKSIFFNIQQNIVNYLDDDYIKKLKKPILLKDKLLNLSYWSTLIVFISGISLFAFSFIKPAVNKILMDSSAANIKQINTNR